MMMNTPRRELHSVYGVVYVNPITVHSFLLVTIHACARHLPMCYGFVSIATGYKTTVCYHFSRSSSKCIIWCSAFYGVPLPIGADGGGEEGGRAISWEKSSVRCVRTCACMYNMRIRMHKANGVSRYLLSLLNLIDLGKFLITTPSAAIKNTQSHASTRYILHAKCI